MYLPILVPGCGRPSPLTVIGRPALYKKTTKQINYNGTFISFYTYNDVPLTITFRLPSLLSIVTNKTQKKNFLFWITKIFDHSKGNTCTT